MTEPLQSLSWWGMQYARLRAWLHLFRIANSVTLALLYIASAHFFGFAGSRKLLLRALCWLCVSAFSYALNDLLDIQIDRRNRPERPLPSGTISHVAAIVATASMGVVALTLSLLCWESPINWTTAGLVGGVYYSFFIRPRYATLANALAAALVTLVPISAQQHSLSASGLAIYGGIFAVIFARELQKDVLDAPGDAISRTVGLLVGPHRRFGHALYMVLLLLASLAFTVAVATMGERRVPFILVAAAPISLLVIALASFAADLGGARVQVILTKVVAYLVVPLLLADLL